MNERCELVCSAQKIEMHVIKGMVQVLGTTYRVVQLKLESYSVIRIRDEVVIGGFSSGTTLKTFPVSVDALLMRQIASKAVHQGRTSWKGRSLAN